MAARPSARQEVPHVTEGKSNARQGDMDPALADTASSPEKPADMGMELDKDPRKRLNMDDAVVNSGHPNESSLLAITDGSDADQREENSPTSSNSSKRAKLGKEVGGTKARVTWSDPVAAETREVPDAAAHPFDRKLVSRQRLVKEQATVDKEKSQWEQQDDKLSHLEHVS
ncbi:hypothetical protein ZWY2020_011350 [Hordeum vulgare]|nr:hypothetical protein ZWY2020_011350 [Hordeum vulgare]